MAKTKKEEMENLGPKAEKVTEAQLNKIQTVIDNINLQDGTISYPETNVNPSNGEVNKKD